ncbi:methyl-accepting chemotaxis protein [Alteromonas macleodii]|uniref:methyl-accepting chemotaxis protein n=1 Tax=Alteromonas macleodii TaxID=28108 RepID=UPI003140C14B
MYFLKRIGYLLYLALPLCAIYLSYTDYERDKISSEQVEKSVEYIFSTSSVKDLDTNFDPDIIPNAKIKAIYINDEFYFNGITNSNADLAFDYFVNKHEEEFDLRVYANKNNGVSVAYTYHRTSVPLITAVLIAVFIVVSLVRANNHGKNSEELNRINRKLADSNEKLDKSNNDLRQIVRNVNAFNFSDLNGEVASKLEKHLDYDAKISTLVTEIEDESINKIELHDAILAYKNRHVGHAYERFERFLGESFERTDEREDVLISLRTDFEMTKEFYTKTKEILSTKELELEEANKTISSLSEDLQTFKRGFEQAFIQVNDLASLIEGSDEVNKKMETISSDSLESSRSAESVSKQAANDMNQIKEFSRRISSIIDLIEDIAFQTQLLALNANVEAARAGEHGKGFAVVAGEVKQLAVRAAESSDEIKKLIQESLTSINSGVKQVESTADALKLITDSIEQISGLTKELTSSSTEQVEHIAALEEVIKSTKIEDQYASYREAVNALNKGMEKLENAAQDTEKNTNESRYIKSAATSQSDDDDSKPKGTIELVPAPRNEELDDIPAHHKNKGDYTVVKHSNEDWESF